MQLTFCRQNTVRKYFSDLKELSTPNKKQNERQNIKNRTTADAMYHVDQEKGQEGRGSLRQSGTPSRR